MMTTLAAKALVQTVASQDRRSLEITLADGSGRTHVVSMTAELAAILVRILSEFSPSTMTAGAVATKLPENFAVGSGRYEKLVLIRFEDDAPYGISSSAAAELGRALIEESKTVCAQEVLTRQ